MHRVLKRFLVFVACVLAAWYAHRPLLGAGFLGSDASVLVEVDRAMEDGGAGALWSVDALDHRPLATASLALSRRLHARDGVYTPGDAGRLRLESLLLLVVAAFGVRAATIRALKPWTGEDHARSAGASAGTFLMLHPLLVPTAAHLEARGDALALAASAWSAALLLSGRQRSNAVVFGGAFLLALLAAASSPAAILLLPLGFGLEFVAAKRHRPFRARLKTATQVAFGYAVAIGIEFGVSALLAPSEAPLARAQGVDPALVLDPPVRGFVHVAGVAAETTGVVVLPVNTTGLGTLGYVPAVFALLAALHPGFVAARAAPRLWGRVLGGWAAAIVVLLVLGTGGERTAPARLADAPGTMPLALTMAVGLGISATALSGGRRALLPAATGGLYAILTAGSAATVSWAAAEVGAMHDVILEAARDDAYARGETWVLDPPRDLFGIRALGPEDDASLTSGPFLPDGAQPVRVRGIPAESLAAFATTPEFEGARASGLTLLVPRGDDPRAVEFAVLRFDPPAASGRGGEVGWVGEGSSPAARSFDPFSLRFAAAMAPADVDVEDVADGAPAPTIHWASSSAEVQAARGVWIQGPSGPEARFALEREAAWLLVGTVDSIWFSAPLENAVAVRLTPAPATLPEPVRPRVVGDDWTIDIAAASPVQPADPGANETWSLRVVDPISGRGAEVPLRGAASGRLVAEGAGLLEGLEMMWILDRALDGVVVERRRGRRGIPTPP